tara:strand:- start:444 stop:884 length:441 start_codon:yes stop_codon:yes gene_type:complete
MKKKGVSPVIATILLIAIGFVLAVIIFMWARGFLSERTLKFEMPIEDACGDIAFEAEAVGGKLGVVNRGNVPLYGAEMRKKGFGTIENVGVFETTITVGDTARVDLGSGISAGETLVVVPIILGESGGAKKTHVCSDIHAKEILVS